MIGIRDIATCIPGKRISNYDRKETFGLTDHFIESKLGVRAAARVAPGQEASDLCRLAWDKLKERGEVDPDAVDVVIVCTQNPDFPIPHASAIVHGKLDLPERCAAFDISLGCSGWVYGLSIIESFMASAGMNNGLLFTADPYSKIIDEEDKNTSLLFGDGAAVTWVSREPAFTTGKFSFGTRGKEFSHLICRDGALHMNGRQIFNFAARTIPGDVQRVLELNGLTMEKIDRFLLHQGSKYIVDFLKKRIGLPEEKTPYVIQDYGNTVSSSIPIMLADLLPRSDVRRVLVSGFGVGLSWASGILTRRDGA
ncbi:MAG: ketoacyl-ACP synthase III [Desulfobacterales bacterium]|nr:ketoacyl-ACP synthase III [Desulfobacterales bacterium]